MNNDLICFLTRHAHWRVMTPLLLLCLGYVWLFNFSAFPYANPALVATGCGEGLLDMRLHYDAAQVYQALACYGPAGRALYQNFLLVDATFAVCYGMCFALLLTWLARTTRTAGKVVNVWAWAGVLPIGIAAFDSLENALLYRLLSAYPQEMPTLAGLAGYATSGKWVLSTLTVIVLVASMARKWNQRG